jgi:uncharacterized protein
LSPATSRCVRLALGAVVLGIWLAFGVPAVQASQEIERLVEQARKGDAAALNSLVDLAGKKDRDAEYALGLMAFEGQGGLERNGVQAFRLVERSAARAHPEALNTLGYFFEQGVGTAASPERALEAYRRGAEAGSAAASNNLGWFYEHGIAVGKDPVAAADAYKKAAEGGLSAAHANLARLYESGTGVARNPVIAIALYERALEAGVLPAALRLGHLLEGRGNLAGATEHFLRAANAQVPDADYEAGRVLIDPANPRRNPELGKQWLERAVARGHGEATKLLQRSR